MTKIGGSAGEWVCNGKKTRRKYRGTQRIQRHIPRLSGAIHGAMRLPGRGLVVLCTLPVAMASDGNGTAGMDGGKGGSQLRRGGSTYLKFIERFAAFCQRSDAMSSSDDSDSAAPRRRRLGRTGGRSWMSGRLGRSKKGPDQVRGELFLCGKWCSRATYEFKHAG